MNKKFRLAIAAFLTATSAIALGGCGVGNGYGIGAVPVNYNQSSVYVPNSTVGVNNSGSYGMVPASIGVSEGEESNFNPAFHGAAAARWAARQQMLASVTPSGPVVVPNGTTVVVAAPAPALPRMRRDPELTRLATVTASQEIENQRRDIAVNGLRTEVGHLVVGQQRIEGLLRQRVAPPAAPPAQPAPPVAAPPAARRMAAAAQDPDGMPPEPLVLDE